MTAINLVRSNKRGSASRKRPLWLPIIAPKDTASGSSFNPPIPVKTSTPRSHARFPPRSRTGCWCVLCPGTCRGRKVKCDERHPRCNQCTRLGHDCDYRPRLSFRDDTRRVIERMSDVETGGNVVWDPHMLSALKAPSADLGIPDLLPSFAALTSDEERERKARYSIPGTYTVMMIPESFHLPELAKESLEEPCRNITSNSLLESGQSSHSEVGSTQTLDSESQGSPSIISVSLVVPNATDGNNAHGHTKLTGYETALLDHFRNVVWPKLAPPMIWVFDHSNGHILSADVFEQEANTFPSLSQTMMALSALSLARQGSDLNMAAMNRTHQDYPLSQNVLHRSEDLLSDGVFLTQFLLLVYEIMAAKLNEPVLWSHHISRLLEITLLRQSAIGVERYPFLIWWVCNIDMYALFSGAGTGEYVRTVIESDLLPGPESILSSIASSGPGAIDSLELNIFTFMLRLYKDVFSLAVRLALKISEMKNLSSTYTQTPTGLQQQAAELYGELKRLWESPDVLFWNENRSRLSKKLQNILEQAHLLFHTSLLFYFTSMWPRQNIGLEVFPERKVHHHATMVLQHAESMICKSQGNHFMTFPLFLAGAAAGSSDLKVKAWELLSNLEESEIGYNVSTTCYILQLVYERQMQQSRNGGASFLEVDWVELLAERGYRLVSFL
ncbi:hypothetical protein BDV23DRAFT_156080 [Aspergillus alliaceus]|uniref:Zn(2)-C6 fungal-type domain-containing protein n=1 Tax=Petromyces alliaceus TaxID=209559 RepID=A0A5N7C775_PETAA|nr:hypothetical protein BDV23DRAFT_156080 [Aspergillus alliaceus]